LGFARKDKFNPIVLDVKEILLDVVKVTEKIFEKNIKVKFDLGGKIDRVKGDKNHFVQVFTNLIINAKDAMPEGGNITIKAETEIITEDKLSTFAKIAPGKYTKISLSDTGTGISDEHLDQIFEPFFSTKSEGEGTGLGLAMVYSIVKNHSGYIDVYTKKDNGTTFNLYFPVTLEESQVSVKEDILVKGNARVLLIDDEEHIQKLGARLLSSIGYDVIVAENGIEGVELFKKDKDNIDIILLDLIMPEMNGATTFYKLREIRDDIKVIIISGFNKESRVKQLIDDGASDFIQKPFKAGELSRAINDVLKFKKPDIHKT